MNKVHRKVEYSLMALKYMSEKSNSDRSSAKEIADAFHAPFDAVARALQLLAQKGILKSEQGAQGGYVLVRELSQLNLLELIEIMEGPTQIAKCLSEHGDSCEIQKSCNIISPIHDLNSRLTDFYRGLSVQEVLKGNQGGVAS